MKITLKVTDDDIALGTRGVVQNCPIVRALVRTLIEQRLPLANLSVSSLPTEALAFVKAFDRGEQVEPFEFEGEVANWFGTPWDRKSCS